MRQHTRMEIKSSWKLNSDINPVNRFSQEVYICVEDPADYSLRIMVIVCCISGGKIS
jgi:hypothetical protein